MELKRKAYRKREAAELIGISVRKLDYLIKEGRLKAAKLDRMVLIPASELEKLIEGEVSQ